MPSSKNPVLISSAGYRKAVVRHCTEQIREIEGRMEQSSGPRWEQQLQTCEDLACVAKLLLALQRRAELKEIDNAWLEELSQLSSAEIDDRAIELVNTRYRPVPMLAYRKAIFAPHGCAPALRADSTHQGAPCPTARCHSAPRGSARLAGLRRDPPGYRGPALRSSRTSRRA